MIGLAPVALVAAAGAGVLALNVDNPTPGWGLAARLLACLAAVLFAGGYAFVMRAGARRQDHLAVQVLSRVSIAAVGAAALLTAWQLIVIDDTVSTGVRVALWVLVVGGILSGAAALIASRLLSRPRP